MVDNLLNWVKLIIFGDEEVWFRLNVDEGSTG